MNIKPLGDRVLVKPKLEEEVTESGIVLPDTVEKEKKAEGEVAAIGNGEKVAKLGLNIGDAVIFEKWGGEEVEVGGTDHKILDHDKILAIIKK